MASDSSVKDSSLKVVSGASSVRRQVYENLRQAILEMRIKPGQRLTERDLIEMTDASRTSVREALRELIADGIVKTVPYNRHIVAIPTPDEARELYEVRGALEALAARRFTSAASDEEVAGLRSAVENYGSASSVTDRLATKGEIYRILGTYAPVVYTVLHTLNARVAMLRTMSLTAPGRHEESVREINTILAAIEARDPEAAARESLAHADQACAVALRLLNESPWAVGINWE
ncbi:GntR family transcriptional regulator [Dactylosporangium roseum]|uniref:GntR family transcriptional regulator n=1 Tax=Dactylosporangium roseum TaxID=47989 RepID=A0ABY5ZAW2_9ACTN|nr:GntR family transcriptional regulator [Dactylosporangium roseum]UWZ39231.1 GntR family transcriptional regulator [Dactylosporangium roseum]